VVGIIKGGKMAEDNWVGRSEEMKCATCMAFVEKKVPVDVPVGIDHRVIGRCRRYAPTMRGFPVVWSDDWCLDHKLDERKIA
jgi:hypothetical protein